MDKSFTGTCRRIDFKNMKTSENSRKKNNENEKYSGIND